MPGEGEGCGWAFTEGPGREGVETRPRKAGQGPVCGDHEGQTKAYGLLLQAIGISGRGMPQSAPLLEAGPLRIPSLPTVSKLYEGDPLKTTDLVQRRN